MPISVRASRIAGSVAWRLIVLIRDGARGADLSAARPSAIVAASMATSHVFHEVARAGVRPVGGK